MPAWWRSGWVPRVRVMSRLAAAEWVRARGVSTGRRPPRSEPVMRAAMSMEHLRLHAIRRIRFRLWAWLLEVPLLVVRMSAVLPAEVLPAPLTSLVALLDLSPASRSWHRI